MKVVSLIPARGGSKSIPKKNLVEVLGFPLIHFVIEASLGSIVEETWVSTNDKEIKGVSLYWGAYVIDRPSEIAGDTSSTEDVVKHFLSRVECDVVVLIQPTSPMVLSNDIDEGIKKFQEGGLDSLFSAAKPDDMLIWNSSSLYPINYDPGERGVRQTRQNPFLIETGAFYIFSRESFLKYNNRLGGRIGYVEVPFWRSFEIDTLEDLKNIEKLMKA